VLKTAKPPVQTTSQPPAPRPKHWPPAPPSELEQSNRAMRTVSYLLVVIVLTQKVAVPGTAGVMQLALFLYFGVMAVLVFQGRAQIAKGRLVLYTLTAAVGMVTQALYHGNTFSFPSFAFVIMIASASMFEIRATREQYLELLRMAQKVGVFAALFVGIDWGVQFLRFPMPNLEAILPEALQIKDFAYSRAMKFGSPYNKPNGFVFLEPSHLSQFLAICLLIEFVFFKRPHYIALFFLGMFFTYGGTGLLLVALAAPFALAYVPARAAIGLGVFAVVALAGAGAVGLLDDVVGRADEFSGKNTSAYFRFVAPFQLIGTALNGTPLAALFGSGAGSSPKGVNVTFLPVAKVLYEYGLFFALFWFPLTIACNFGKGRSVIVGWMMFVQYHLLNGSLLVPTNFLYCMLFSGLFVFPQSEKKRESLPNIRRVSDREPGRRLASSTP
jgi:hypothetical protein